MKERGALGNGSGISRVQMFRWLIRIAKSMINKMCLVG
jgi:hypothetical protein